MSDAVKVPAAGFTIAVVIDVSPPLRTLLERLLPLAGATVLTVSRGVGAAGEPGQVGGEPGPEFLDVSSLTSPAAVVPPPAPLPKPKRTARKKGGGKRRGYRGRVSPTRSPEREAWLKDNWPAGVDEASALVALNRLPGARMPNVKSVRNMVGRMKLRRSPAFVRASQQKGTNAMAAKRRGETAEQKPPAPVPVAAPSPAERPAARVMTAAEVAARRNGTALKPIQATSLEILHWGAEHGCRQDKLDIAAMNAHRRHLKVAEFELIVPARAKAA